MSERAIWRLQDMQQSVADIRSLLDGKCFDDLMGDRVAKAAFERYLEVLSEASRHVPQDWRDAIAPEIPWRRIADLGNHVRHAYHRIDAELLWNIYVDHLDPLELAITKMLKTFGRS